MKKHIKDYERFKEIREKKQLYNVGKKELKEYSFVLTQAAFADFNRLREYFNTIGGHDVPDPWPWHVCGYYDNVLVMVNASSDSYLNHCITAFLDSDLNNKHWSNFWENGGYKMGGK